MSKIWLTKHALTRGIVLADGQIHSERLATDRSKPEFANPVWKPHWHTSHEGAVARAEQMRARKIASLQKQLAKLVALHF